MTKVVIITREKLETCPPLISHSLMLADYDVNLMMIAGDCNERVKKIITQKGIDIKIIKYHYGNELFKIKKVLSSIKFRLKTNRLLSDIRPDFVIVEGQGAFKILGSSLKKYNYILYILELYQNRLNMIRKIIYDAKAVVLPEYNRAVLYETYFNLNKRPYILPNKPYFDIVDTDIEKLKEKYCNELALFFRKKVVLYQGIIAEERDLTNYIKAVNELGEEYEIVLLGKDWGVLDKYKKNGLRFTHIDFIPAPDYLIFTKYAHIGILTYNPKDLNCAYCAPNKLYEYSKFGLPMIGNNIPGLRYTIGNSKAGVIIDDSSVLDIENGIRKIDSNYKFYSDQSVHFFNDQNNEVILEKIVADMKTQC